MTRSQIATEIAKAFAYQAAGNHELAKSHARKAIIHIERLFIHTR